jgi:hypothetical protein
MENLADYSNYITAAYLTALLALVGLATITVAKFFTTK